MFERPTSKFATLPYIVKKEDDIDHLKGGRDSPVLWDTSFRPIC